MKGKFLTKAEYIAFKNESRAKQQEIKEIQLKLANVCVTQKCFDHFYMAKLAEERLNKTFRSTAKPYQHILTQPIVRIR